MLEEQILAQALLLAGSLDEKQTELLKLLCRAANSSLASRLKDGLSPGDCKADFVAAASLLALSALNATQEEGLEQFTAGDLTVRRRGKSDAASNCLRAQAELMIAPYLKDRFSFMGV